MGLGLSIGVDKVKAPWSPAHQRGNPESLTSLDCERRPTQAQGEDTNCAQKGFRRPGALKQETSCEATKRHIRAKYLRQLFLEC